jgi:hypothetical protein
VEGQSIRLVFGKRSQDGTVDLFYQSMPIAEWTEVAMPGDVVPQVGAFVELGVYGPKRVLAVAPPSEMEPDARALEDLRHTLRFLAVPQCSS